MRPRPSRIALLGLLAAVSCSKKPTEGALRVLVHLTPDARADCVAVAAQQTAGGPEKVTKLVPRNGLTDLVFGVVSGEGLQGELRVVARGFVGACDGSGGLNVESEPVVHALPVGEVAEIELTLDQPAFDDDHDGYRRADAGGPDCDDADAGTSPAVAERCDDGFDNNCNRLTDCADLATCEGERCDDGLACTVMDRCVMGACHGMTLACDQPPATGCFASMGRCGDDGGCLYDPTDAGALCSGGVCRNDGVCVPAGTEFDCTNGLDDDGDLAADCADPDCLTVTCDDRLACTQNDKCLVTDAGGCLGTQNPCSQPPDQCRADAGTCVEPTGTCVYPVAVGRSCLDADFCTTSEVCQSDGGCGGTARTCTQSGDVCHATSGSCDATQMSCLFAVNAGAACDDTNPCTASDVCQPTSGLCQGTTYSCSSPPNAQCYAPTGSCEGDGGCTYVVNVGFTCLGTGVCAADGGCSVPDAGVDAGAPDAGPPDAGPLDAGNGFPYVPSNFNPAAIGAAMISDAVLVNCGNAAINTSALTFTRCAGQTVQPQVFQLTQTGGLVAAAIAVRGLTITTAGTLTVTGNKPLIIISLGDVEIQSGGSLLANSTRGGPNGAGAGIGCGAMQNGKTGVTGAQSGGGGGGGLGQAGSKGSAAQGGQQGGAAGVADSNAPLTPLNGGCRGGNGLGTSTAEGGAGGGAVQISSTTQLRLSGVVSVSAAGGNPAVGTPGNAGAGGGSGGAILLEAMSVTIATSAIFTANGGGGGEGSALATGTPVFGGDGSTNSTVPATKGAGGSTGGGDGATGGTSTSPPGTATDGTTGSSGFNGGGGGGGGGIGRIRINAFGGAGTCSFVGSPVFSAVRSSPSPCPP